MTGNGLDMSVERWFVGMKRKGMKTRGVKKKYGMHGAKETRVGAIPHSWFIKDIIISTTRIVVMTISHGFHTKTRRTAAYCMHQ